MNDSDKRSLSANTCGAKHPRWTNVGPCLLYAGKSGHHPTVYPHMAIVTNERSGQVTRRWLRWFEQPRSPLVPDSMPDEYLESRPVNEVL